MQQMSSQENSAPQEIYRLGERYHLGAAEGAYYISYTQEDINRYHMTIVLCFITILLLVLFIALGLLINFDLRPYLGSFAYTINLWPFLPLYIALSLRRKWGNRPFIAPGDRQQRVYVYHDGLIKLTAKRCDIVRWPQMYDVVYTPPKAGDQPGTFNSQRAGIQLALYNRHSLTLSGALPNLEELAWRIKRACNQNRHTETHTDGPLIPRLDG
jgi:hypothetical protein